MSIDAETGDTRIMLTTPAGFSRDVMIDKNKARQLLIPEQTVELAEDASDSVELEIAADRSVRVVRRKALAAPDEHALLVPATLDIAADGDLRVVREVKWLSPPAPESPAAVLDSLEGAFQFLEDDSDGGKSGLRSPQLGALHSLLGYWTTDPKEPATVVMPTGTGKTETMLALFAYQRLERLLVIVPSDALRTQVGGKFESFGVLQEFGVVSPDASRPVVGQLRHSFSSVVAAEEFAEACNVVIATPNALNASDEDVRAAFMAKFTHLFVDEAHHVAAETWRAIRDAFQGKRVVQFTATPFREDGRHLGGRVLYVFPLREAQRQNYFSEINYVSVVEFDDPDGAIAREAIERLRADLENGLDHILMARVRRIGRATELLSRYQELAGDLNPVVVHSKNAVGVRQQALAAVRERTSRIVICVDMLGEGFDLPSLKIAAIHDPHKSLGITLQFVGRFARVSDSSLGTATVVVGRPEMEYDDNLRKLYSEDADWNRIIRDLSETAVEEQEELSEFEAAFAQLPEQIAMANLVPKMSTVVYRSDETDWDPQAAAEIFGAEQILTYPIPTNERDRVAWFVVERRAEVPWGDVRALEDIGYDLYVLYWDEARGLLFINSSNKSSFHEELAKAVMGDGASRINGENVYRVMAAVNRLVPTNVGVLDVRNRARRFSMYVGADVAEGFPVAEAQTKTKTNIFANGFENGRRISIGASLKGRVWSYRVATSLKQWVDWCNEVGTKLLDETINIDALMESFIRPQVIEERPELAVLSAEWPWEIFLSTSEETRIERGGVGWPLVDAELEIASSSTTGPIQFDIVTENWRAQYEAAFIDGSIVFRSRDDAEANIVTRRSSLPVSAFLSKNGLQFHLEQDATIVHPGLLLRPDREMPPFDRDKLEALDWTGINLQKESQGPNRDSDSIQARTLAHLLDLADWDIVLDDDGTGEIADLVALVADEHELHVTIAHCKYSGAPAPGARVSDLYELCGQAQKSVRWRRNIDYMFRHLIRRERNRQQAGRSGFMKGTAAELHELHDRARFLQPRLTIVLAQPGVTKAGASDAQLELLASTELYVRETALADIAVYCNA